MALAIRVNDFLSGLFLGVGIRLVDFKIETGRLWEGENMRIVLAERSPETRAGSGTSRPTTRWTRTIPQGPRRHDRGLYRGRPQAGRGAGGRVFARGRTAPGKSPEKRGGRASRSGAGDRDAACRADGAHRQTPMGGPTFTQAERRKAPVCCSANRHALGEIRRRGMADGRTTLRRSQWGDSFLYRLTLATKMTATKRAFRNSCGSSITAHVLPSTPRQSEECGHAEEADRAIDSRIAAIIKAHPSGAGRDGAKRCVELAIQPLLIA